jgi:hypothetical protein
MHQGRLTRVRGGRACGCWLQTRYRAPLQSVAERFEIRNDANHILFDVPHIDAVWCYLERQRFEYDDRVGGIEALSDALDTELLDEDDEDAEGDEAYGASYAAARWFEDEAGDMYGDLDSDDLAAIAEDTDAIWEVAAMLGIGRHAPGWWMAGTADHANDCDCRPLSLLEVLQYHSTGAIRQAALEAHLGALQEVWHHFWSGDAVINGSSEEINGACVACLTEGREHLSTVLDEARNLAEELGEALAAFHSHIDIGLDRY